MSDVVSKITIALNDQASSGPDALHAGALKPNGENCSMGKSGN